MDETTKGQMTVPFAYICVYLFHFSMVCVFVYLCNIQFSGHWKIRQRNFNRCSQFSLWSTSLDSVCANVISMEIECIAFILCIVMYSCVFALKLHKHSQISRFSQQFTFYRNQTTNSNRNKLQFDRFCCCNCSRIDAQSKNNNICAVVPNSGF